MISCKAYDDNSELFLDFTFAEAEREYYVIKISVVAQRTFDMASISS